ncbi:hypothetical protein [Gimesia sp.]|uniref:hypothetical protein n=1 Tax=Gimesia sp. TaxID=2024833 RepID=UPI003A95AFAF
MKCEKCGQNRKVILRFIQSDVCEACGHIPLSGRLMRVFLQVIAVLMFAGGLLSFSESLVAGTVISLMAIALLTVTLRHSRRGIRKLLEVTRKVTARTSKWALCFLFLVLLIVPAWIWMDASFQSAYTWARVDLGIPDEMGEGYLEVSSLGDLFRNAEEPSFYQRTHSLSVLGPRIGVMIFIMCGSVVSLLLAGTHIMLRDASKMYLVGFTLVVCGLVAVVSQQDNLLWHAVRYRVSNDLPRFQRALEPLLQEWPTKSGTLPEIGKYFAHEERPGRLTPLGKTQYRTYERFGADIEQLPDDGVSFTLSPHYLYLLEYHPPGSTGPQVKISGDNWISHLVRSDRIAESWYLTQYDSVRNTKSDRDTMIK